MPDVGDLTLTGEVVGTLAFMPPEQALGADTDTRADVYAIGAILYHVLSKRVPYDHVMQPDRLASMLAGPPIDLARHEPHVAADLLAILRKAMDRDPNARYDSAKQLAVDLRRFQEGRLVAARTYSTRELLGHFIHRQRTILRIIALSALLLAILGIYSYAQVAAQRHVADVQRAQAVDAQRSEATMRALAEARARESQRIAVDQLVETGRRDLYERQEPQRALSALAQAYYIDPSRDDLRRMLHEAAAHANNLQFVLHDVAGFRYSSTGDRIVTWDGSTSVSVRDTHTGAEDFHILLAGPAHWAMFVPNTDDRIVVATDDGIQGYTRHSLDWKLGPGTEPLSFAPLTGDHVDKALLAGREGGMILDLERGEMTPVPAVRAGFPNLAAPPPDLLTAAHPSHIKATWTGTTLIVAAPEDGGVDTSAPWTTRLARFALDGTRSGSDQRFIRNPTHSFIFSPDGSAFTYVTGSTAMLGDATGRERRLEQCGELDVTRTRPPEPTAAFTLDSTAIIRLLGDGRIARWNAKTAECEASRDDLDLQYDRLAITPDDGLVVVVGKHGLIRVLDSRTLTQREQFFAGSRPIQAFAVRPGPAQIAVLHTDGALRLWNLGDPRLLNVSAPANPHGTDPNDEELHLFEVLRGIPRANVEDWHCMLLVQDGESSGPHARELRIVGIPYRSVLSLLNAWNGMLLARLRGDRGNFSPDGRYVFTSLAGDDLTVYDARSGAELDKLVSPTNIMDFTSSRMEVTTFSSDWQLFAFAGTHGPITIWDADTFEELGVLHGHLDEALDLRFSPSSDYLLSIADEKNSDGQVFLWDLNTLQGRRLTVTGVTFAVFAPDNEFVALGTREGTVQLWDTATGAQVGVLRGHDRPVTHIEHADGDRLITTADGDRTVTWQLGKESRQPAELERFIREVVPL